MDIIFGDEHLKLQDKLCGVYQIVMNDKWFYIGSSVDLKKRLHSWKHYLINKEKFKKNRSIIHILPLVEKVNFYILELVNDGSNHKIREDFWIKKSFNDEDCLNLVPDAIGGKGRKIPLGYIQKEKKIKGLPTEKKRVAQFDLQGNLIKVYDSIGDASRVTGVKLDIIRKVFNGKIMSPRKYIFKGVNKDGTYIEPKTISKVSVETIKFIVKNYNKLGNAELCRILNLSPNYVSSIAFGRSRKGFITDGLPIPKKVSQPKKVIQYDLMGNEINRFNSIGEASRNTGIRTSAIQEVLTNRGGRKQSKGFVFKFELNSMG